MKGSGGLRMMQGNRLKVNCGETRGRGISERGQTREMVNIRLNLNHRRFHRPNKNWYSRSPVRPPLGSSLLERHADDLGVEHLCDVAA